MRRIALLLALLTLIAATASAQQTIYSRQGSVRATSALTAGQMCRAIDGNYAGFFTPADDVLLVGNGSTWEDKTLSDCDAAGKALTYDTTTNTFGCASTGAGGTFDSTNYGNATWGSGTGYTWTFDASGGADAALTLGDGAAVYTGDWTLDNQKDLRLREADANGDNYVGLQAPASLAGDVTLTWNALAECTAGVLTIDSTGAVVCAAVNLTTDLTGALPIGSGGTGQTGQTAAFDALDPLTTKGDVLGHNGTNSIRVPVSVTDGQVLTVDAASSAGIKWAAAPGGIATLAGNSGSASGPTVSVLGSEGILTTAISATLGVEWAPQNTVGHVVFWNGANATRTLTANLSGSTDPVLTFGDGVVNLSTGTLQQGGTAVSLAGHSHSTTDISSGTLGYLHGGTGLNAYAQGDLLYASATNTLSTLPKDSGTTRFLSNTGTSNAPAWAQVNLTTGVTGTLPLADGGTNKGTAWTAARCVRVNDGGTALEAGAADCAAAGIQTLNASSGSATGTTVSILGSEGVLTSAIGSIVGVEWAPQTTVGNVVFWNGANASRVLTANLSGSTDPVLTFGDGVVNVSTGTLQQAGTAVSLAGHSHTTTDISSGTFGVARGGTGISGYAQGDLLYASGASTLVALPKSSSATRYLANTGTTNNPAWAQVNLTNGVTGTLPLASGGTNQTAWTAGDCVRVNGGGTALESAGAACGAGGGGAPSTAQYVTLAVDPTLSGERVLTKGGAIDVSDTGPNGTVVLDWDATEVNDKIFGDGSEATIQWTYNVTGADPVVQYGDGTVNVSSGVLQQGGSAVVDVGDTGTVTGTMVLDNTLNGFDIDETTNYAWTGTHSFSGGLMVLPSRLSACTSVITNGQVCWDSDDFVASIGTGAARAVLVDTGRTISAGTGLTGGGDLSANRTLSVAANGIGPTQIDETANYTWSGNNIHDAAGSEEFRATTSFFTNVLVADQNDLRLFEMTSNGFNSFGFQAPSSIASDATFTWAATGPCTGTGPSGGVLTIDGSNNIVCDNDDSGAGMTGSGTDNHLVRWDGTSAVQDSGWTLNDTDKLFATGITFTSTSGAQNGLEVQAALNNSSSTTANTAGIYGLMSFGGSAGGTGNARVRGVAGVGYNQSGSAVTFPVVIGGDFTALAVNAASTDTLRGVSGIASRSGTGGVNTVAEGGYFRVINSDPSGSIAFGTGVHIDAPVTTGTISAYYPLYADGNYPSYFAGQIGLGTGTTPKNGIGAAKLAIDGTDNSLAGPHVQYTTSADNYPLFQQLPYTHDNIWMMFDSYWDGAAFRMGDSGTGSAYAIYKGGFVPDTLTLAYASGTQGSAITFKSALKVSNSEVVFNEDSNDLDTRFETDGNASALLVNAGANTIEYAVPLSGVVNRTDTSGIVYLNKLTSTLTPASGTTADILGTYVSIGATGSNALASGATLTGTYSRVTSNVSAASTGAILYGTYAEASKEGTGQLGNVAAVYAWARNENITGTLDNAYGVYIANSETTGPITNDWALYTAGTEASRFGGPVGIGTTGAPASGYDLDVYDASSEALARLRSAGTNTDARLELATANQSWDVFVDESDGQRFKIASDDANALFALYPDGRAVLQTTTTATSSLVRQLYANMTISPSAGGAGFYGVNSVVTHTGTGQVSSASSMAGSLVSSGSGGMVSATGMSGSVTKSGTGDMTTVSGVRGTVTNNESTNAIDTAYGGYFQVSALAASSHIGTGYGVYIGDSGTTGTITNDYGLYQAGGERNYLGGALGIGTTAVPKGGIGYAKLALEGANQSGAGPHVQYTTATDDYPVFQQLNWAHDNVMLCFDCYWDSQFRSGDSGTGTSYALYKGGLHPDELSVYYTSPTTQGGVITLTRALTFGGSEVVFNEDSNDLDTRFETNTNASALLINAGADDIEYGVPIAGSISRTDTSGTVYLNQLLGYLSPPSATTADLIGSNVQVFGQGANALSAGATVIAYYGIATSDVSAASTGAGVYGVTAVAKKTGTGQLGRLYGIYAATENTNATGAVDNAYGVYIADSTTTGAITNDWALYTAGTESSYFGGPVLLAEQGTGPAVPVADTQARLYVKGDKLVVQFNNGGTARYFTMDLTQSGATATWAQSTSAP